MKFKIPDSRFQILDSRNGFTLFEVIISVAIITLMTVAAIVIIDPGRQFAKNRNTQRWSDLNVILNAVGQNTVDNRGTFSCGSGAIPTSTQRMASSTYNIAPCLVPNYLSALPFDPATTGAKYSNTSTYDTAYNILRNATTGRVTVSAPAAELGESVSVTR